VFAEASAAAKLDDAAPDDVAAGKELSVQESLSEAVTLKDSRTTSFWRLTRLDNWVSMLS